MSFREAMKELAVPDSAPPEEKLRAVCQWELGYPEWAMEFLQWAKSAGYEVTVNGEPHE